LGKGATDAAHAAGAGGGARPAEGGGGGPKVADPYAMGLRASVFWGVCGALATFGALYLFYRSAAVAAALCPLGLTYARLKAGRHRQRQRSEFRAQFRDMTVSLSSSVFSGRSVENALKAALQDLTALYGGPDAMIVAECHEICRNLDTGMGMEASLRGFAQRVGQEDVDDFVGIMLTCRKSGGDMVTVIRNAVDVIGDRMAVMQEIETATAQKRLEKSILNATPVALLAILSLTSGDYMAPVFETLPGRLAMTVCIGLMALSWLISGRIVAKAEF